MAYTVNRRLEVYAYQIIPPIIKTHSWSARGYFKDVDENGKDIKVFVTDECWGRTRDEADSNARKADIDA